MPNSKWYELKFPDIKVNALYIYARITMQFNWSILLNFNWFSESQTIRYWRKITMRVYSNIDSSKSKWFGWLSYRVSDLHPDVWTYWPTQSWLRVIFTRDCDLSFNYSLLVPLPPCIIHNTKYKIIMQINIRIEIPMFLFEYFLTYFGYEWNQDQDLKVSCFYCFVFSFISRS